jgi:hypothetical protein
VVVGHKSICYIFFVSLLLWIANLLGISFVD